MAPSAPPPSGQAASAGHNDVPTVQVHALSAGHMTLPEEQFIRECTEGMRKTVPSLCFLVEHVCRKTNSVVRIVFDLGLRRDVRRYADPIQRHIEKRQPMETDPDVVKSLKKGGLTAEDIDYVIYSHVHWDHVGEPRDFTRSTFIVGNGSLDLLSGNSAGLRGGHSFFEADLLDLSRTIELASPGSVRPSEGFSGPRTVDTPINYSQPWKPLGGLPWTLDLFGDGSLYIVDAPGHLRGHINLLARTSSSDGGDRWVYLAGDACHDRRILRKEKDIGEWLDAHGHVCCIHENRAQTEATLDRIRLLEEEGVEVILAHDVEWEKEKSNEKRFFGAAPRSV
ncbi:glycoside hydrolase family 18 protein [Purpureocillium lavendulum]|uniref:Glycoside hydrolase family 18 protein n=1 Tax=Purpureocillium lavendulum TaxID=1247861 RepID=A0AB34FTY0_9HYPO|nr:glycoside hydrolase family 18 protein [Purpureocillium lavendulum]